MKFTLRTTTPPEYDLPIMIMIHDKVWEEREQNDNSKKYDIAECQECQRISMQHLQDIVLHLFK